MRKLIKKLPRGILPVCFIVMCVGLQACNFKSSYAPRYVYKYQKQQRANSQSSAQQKRSVARADVKDNKRSIWKQRNSHINKFVSRYSRRNSTAVKVSLQRAKRYLPYIRQELKKRRLPMELAYLPMLESSFDPKAKSPTGATGLWQFTKGTAGDYGLKVGWFRDDRLNWKKSTKAAVAYLDWLGKRYNYNWELALAAYNGGPGYISKQMKRQRSWNFWRLKLRRETSEYVPKFIAMLQVAKKRYPGLYQG